MGGRFALDDFGSGFSSFGYLKSLPVDYLKVDGHFVRGITHDSADRAMVEAVNHIGREMGLRTIAEYVADEAILTCLRSIGVDYAQGFGTGRPVPFADHLATLRVFDQRHRRLLTDGAFPVSPTPFASTY